MHSSQGRDREAFSECQRSLATAPNHYWAHTYLADLLLASPHPDFRDYAQALVHAKRAVEQLATNARSHHSVSWTLGRAYYRSGEFAAAVEALQTKGGVEDATSCSKSAAGLRLWLVTRHRQ